jgi:hypothetical protein
VNAKIPGVSGSVRIGSIRQTGRGRFEATGAQSFGDFSGRGLGTFKSRGEAASAIARNAQNTPAWQTFAKNAR